MVQHPAVQGKGATARAWLATVPMTPAVRLGPAALHRRLSHHSLVCGAGVSPALIMVVQGVFMALGQMGRGASGPTLLLTT